jgi:Glycosyl hydrolase family 3 C-terminal domain
VDLGILPHFQLCWQQPDDQIAQAGAIAAECDVALVLAGRITREGMDADHLTLPGTQQKLITAVAAANPQTIVVTLGAGQSFATADITICVPSLHTRSGMGWATPRSTLMIFGSK